MGKPLFSDLGSFTSAVTGTAQEVAHLETLSVLVGGTFVGTVSVEGSLDGTTFVPIPNLTALTAPAIVEVPMRFKQVRADVTAFTSGTIEVKASGEDTDSKG